jgi:hypothetical protein
MGPSCNRGMRDFRCSQPSSFSPRYSSLSSSLSWDFLSLLYHRPSVTEATSLSLTTSPHRQPVANPPSPPTLTSTPVGDESAPNLNIGRRRHCRHEFATRRGGGVLAATRHHLHGPRLRHRASPSPFLLTTSLRTRRCEKNYSDSDTRGRKAP